tara:strand:+ start:149 stop:745 length:597 start_codon:yes stop_codon:yes gene_type:complete
MIQESNVGNLGDDNNDVPLLKVKEKKVRAPLTDKQKEGLSKGRETRDKNAAIRKATRVLQAETLLSTFNKSGAKVESNTDYKRNCVEPVVEVKKIRTPNPPLEKVESNTDYKRNCIESESEEEEIIYKKKPKPVPVEVKKPKKKRTVIVYEESSDDEESKEVEEDYHFPPRELKSQQNRKSQIQQHNERQVTKNFFCS